MGGCYNAGGGVGGWLALLLAGTASLGDSTQSTFNLDSLTNDARYDFTHLLRNRTNDDFDNYFNPCVDSPYDSINFDCSYSSPIDYKDVPVNDLTFMSFNVQSLNAKYDDLHELINLLWSNNSAPDVICLQELWQFPADVDFNITGYKKLEFKLRRDNVQGGGVGLYVKSTLSYSVNIEFSIFVDRIFESLFIELTSYDNKKLLLGTIYRPAVNHPSLNATEQFNQFHELFTNLLSNLTNKNCSTFLMGDFNRDLLKYNICSKVTEYVETFFSYGFLQIITKPTRCTPNSATLIDHCLTNCSPPSHRSVISTCSISDHFPIIYYLNSNKPQAATKNIESRNFSTNNINSFKNVLNNSNWDFVIENNNPQKSSNLFSNFFNNLYDLYFPVTVKRFNKNFHKVEPWCTFGILTSRKTKLKLGSDAARFPNGNSKTIFKTYRNIYNKTVRAAKKIYYESELLTHQSDSKKTWALIRSALK